MPRRKPLDQMTRAELEDLREQLFISLARDDDDEDNFHPDDASDRDIAASAEDLIVEIEEKLANREDDEPS